MNIRLLSQKDTHVYVYYEQNIPPHCVAIVGTPSVVITDQALVKTWSQAMDEFLCYCKMNVE